MSRPLQAAARRLADQNTDRLNGIPADKLWVLTVVSVAAGGSPKGNAVITVSWRGSDVAANDYCASFTPAPGDRVLCAHLADNQLIVIDRMAG